MNERTPAAEQEWTLGRLLDWTAKHLAQKGLEYPRLDAEVLLAHAAGCKRIDLYGMRYSEPATPEVRQAYRALIGHRLEGCPVAYLVGRKEFYGMELKVGPGVLIPRPDSEHVVMQALDLARLRPKPTVLDIGTGSGNLALAIARYLPSAQITAVDLSPDALAIAAENAQKHGIADRVRFLQGDLFAPLGPDERFDLIVSNPPYIPSAAIVTLAGGVRDFEPHLALDGGSDGLAVFQRLIEGARQHLRPGGALIVEIGSPQEEPARQRLAALPGYVLEPTIHDFSGHPRVVVARFEPTS